MSLLSSQSRPCAVYLVMLFDLANFREFAPPFLSSSPDKVLEKDLDLFRNVTGCSLLALLWTRARDFSSSPTTCHFAPFCNKSSVTGAVGSAATPCACSKR